MIALADASGYDKNIVKFWNKDHSDD